jgi:hypothetical protein
MILRRANPLLGPLKEVVPGNLAFFWHVAIPGPKKASISRAQPFQWPSNWICLPQNHYVPRHINKQQVH